MSVIGEAALAAFFDALFSKLAEFLNVVTEKQVREELHKWKKILPSIQAVLDDAEEKHVKDRHVKRWLTELQHLAYDADDVLDEFATEALRRKLTREHQDSSSKLQKLLHTCFSHTFSSNSEMMSMIKEITTRFQELAERKSALALTEHVGGRPKRAIERPPTTSLVTETQVYGRENDKDAIFELISNRNVAEICVIPIVGMGGIGKTTLAKLVYNGCHELLHIEDCPKLKFLPSKEMLPSLLQLVIYNYPLLIQRCKKDEGQECRNIAHIPYICW